MRDEDFEWDDAKAKRNWRSHGITFEMARDVFKDSFAVEWAEDGHTEQRFTTLGVVEGRVLFVSWTMRGDKTRIISARLAEPFERRRYHDENRT